MEEIRMSKLRRRHNRRMKRIGIETGEYADFAKTNQEYLQYLDSYKNNHCGESLMNFKEWSNRWNKRPNDDAMNHVYTGSFESNHK